MSLPHYPYFVRGLLICLGALWIGSASPVHGLEKQNLLEGKAPLLLGGMWPFPGLEGIWFVLATHGFGSLRVADSTGQPLSDAHIIFSSNTWPSALEGRTSKAGFGLTPALVWGELLEVAVKLPGYTSVTSTHRLTPGLAPLWLHLDIELVKLPYVRGSIVDESGYPIAAAQVSLHSPGQKREVLTRVDGSFCFESTEISVTTLLTFKARGFATDFRELSHAAADSEVDLGQVRLKSERNRIGIVRNTNGEPVAGAKIALVPGERLWDQMSDVWPAPAPWATSDEEGRFQLKGLPRGNQLALFVTAAGFSPFYQPLGAEPLPLEIVLQSPTFVQGVVVDGNGSPTPALVVVDVANTFISAVADERGKFKLGPLRPGPRRIRAVDTLAQLDEPDEILVPPEGIEDLVLTLKSSLTVRGQVVGPAGEAVEGATVVFKYPNWSQEAGTNAGGGFVFEEISRGQVIAHVGHPKFGSLVQPIELFEDMPQLTFQLSNLQQVPLTLEIASSQGAVEGAVVVATDSSFRQRKTEAVSDAYGIAFFPELPVGSYQLEVRCPGFLPRSLELVHQVGNNAQVPVRIEPASQVEGLIRNISQAELARLMVTAIHKEPFTQVEAILDRSDGQFLLPELFPGEWELWIRLNYRSIRRSFVVDSGSEMLEVDWLESDPAQ